MSTHKTGTRYDEDFKRTLVELYHNGKTPCFSHQGVWSISNRHDVDLTIRAFEKAYSDRGEPDYVLFHSDYAEYVQNISLSVVEMEDYPSPDPELKKNFIT